MAIAEDGLRRRVEGPAPDLLRASAATRFADAARAVADAATLDEALQIVVEAAVAATTADVAVARVVDPADAALVARAVASASPVRAAEVEGSRFPAVEAPEHEVTERDELPAEIRRLAAALGASALVQVPAVAGGHAVATLELMTAGPPFAEDQIAVARIAASQIGLAVQAFAADVGRRGARPAGEAAPLEIAAEALGVGDQPGRLARLAAEAAGARAAVLWRAGTDGEAAPVASFGTDERNGELAEPPEAVRAVLAGRGSVVVADGADAAERMTLVAVALGRPPLGALQLTFPFGRQPPEADLAAFAGRAAQALRAAERAEATALELERTRALLDVLERAIEQLSLAHTLETVLARVASLFGVERVAVYIKDGDRLVAAAAQGLTGPHATVAERLLELALGPFRGRGLLVVEDAAADERLTPISPVLAESDVEAALAAPLVAREDVIGLLALYPRRGHVVSPDEETLLGTLAAQLAVAVQNARLHEQAKQLGADLEVALDAERQSARRLRALYEVSRSFAQSLSLDATLDAVARAAVESLEVDAAVIRVPDARGDSLVTQALHVADPRLGDALSTMLSRAQVLSRAALERLLPRGRTLTLDVATARSFGGSFGLLVPFLEKGSTAVVVPVATPSEVFATITLISLDPARPIGAHTREAALSLAGHAALAVENARLYQQQKQFADAMQRALLPRSYPDVDGLELGVVYESSARMDVGGDVYDFMCLDDGRLAVILGDVTGHGIDAAADMAMAKFVFRSVAREHPEPADFLMHANDVVAGEIGFGKFITLVYLAVDPADGEVASAGAGHPEPRLVRADGTVTGLDVRGLALGVDAEQRYDEVRDVLAPGDAVVLYTDGVVEARRNGELYGVERLDAVLARVRTLPPEALARAVVDDCRRFAGGELPDDCALVVVRRSVGDDRPTTLSA